jgi:hypothetical protein
VRAGVLFTVASIEMLTDGYRDVTGWKVGWTGACEVCKVEFSHSTRHKMRKALVVGLQTVRDRVLRFNARGPEGLVDGKAPGNARKLDDAQRQALADIVDRGPIPAIHEVVRWRSSRRCPGRVLHRRSQSVRLARNDHEQLT